MNKTSLYWQVYLNLEKEVLALADTIYINDAQQEVFSMRIADLLIRTVIEIEAIAKELYLSNGGAVMSDEDMYFDTVCMAHLNELWDLDKKVVQVVSPNIYFEIEENKVLRPLHKAHKRGSSSADWNKAYQAVKHNRVKELSKGNIRNLLHGLAALFILNLYYRDEKYTSLSNQDKSNVSSSFGSKLFAIKIHNVNGLRSDGVYTLNADYDECVYIQDHEPASKKVAMDAMATMNDYVKRETIAELNKAIKAKTERGEEITHEWVNQERANVNKRILPIKDYKLGKQITDGLAQIRYNVVLNKKQYSKMINGENDTS